MRMKADERNNKDLQCDLGSSFEPSNVSQHQKLDETGVCTMKLFIALSISKKKVCGCLVGPLIGSDGSKGQAYLYYAANLRIKLQTKNTKLLLCHRVST